jgi:hypothetical protein
VTVDGTGVHSVSLHPPPPPADPGGGPRPPHATVAGLLVRHWLAPVPLVVLTVLAVVGIEASQPTTYGASATLLLARPEADPARFPDTESTLRAVEHRLDGPTMRNELGLDTSDLQAVVVDENSLEVLVRGPTPSDARQRLRDVAAWVEQDLAATQSAAGYAPADRTRVRVVAPDPVPVVDLAGDFEAAATIYLEHASLMGENPNPYDASVGTLQLLQVGAMSDHGKQRIAREAGEDVEVHLWVEPRERAPVIHVVARAPAADDALRGVRAGQRLLEDQLEQRQDRAQVPQAARVWVDPLSHPYEADRLSPWLGMSSLVVLATGGALAIGTAALAEWLDRRRRARAEGVIARL